MMQKSQKSLGIPYLCVIAHKNAKTRGFSKSIDDNEFLA